MKQITLAATGFELVTKRTRKREFLDEMNLVVPWSELVGLIQPHAPAGKTGRAPFAVLTMLRIHFMQQWFGLSDPAMEEALHDVPLYREFAGLDAGASRMPDESTILRFRHLLEEHALSLQLLATINATLAAKGLMLKTGTVVDATLIAAPSSTKNNSGKRDPQMHQTKKGNQWHFGMKAHVGVDAETKLIHSVEATAANVADSRVLPELLHGAETDVWGDQAYQGKTEVIRQRAPKAEDRINRRYRTRKICYPDIRKENREKSRTRSRVEHIFGVMKLRFGFTRVRYRGLAKNLHRLLCTCTLINLYTASKHLLQGPERSCA
jgi:IS5 family transposase